MTDPAQLIAGLQSPAAYDHPVERVEVIETHISWVLLAGAFAYKVKKPVHLEFADFSTLERRRFFCQEELRLNRRLAPRLYLSVVPIAGTPERPKVNRPGEPIEYAVQMQRFPQEALLSHRAEQGRLTAEEIKRLALVAADFHQRIAVADPGGPWGSFESVRQPIEENFDELLPVTSPGDSRHERLQALRAWNREQLNRLRETIEARRREGFVRECHGDMHLGNIVLLPPEGPAPPNAEELVIFDGIDFNENLRWIDVQNEIAFTLVDLDQRGQRPLAWRFLNAYLTATGDYAGLAVLPLYLNYRALVRAKVDWIRGHQTRVGGEERRRLEAEFSRYLALAERYVCPPHPRLFLTCGASGSGKTHFARRLAEAVGAVQVRSDAERKRMFLRLGPPSRNLAPRSDRENWAGPVCRAGPSGGATRDPRSDKRRDPAGGPDLYSAEATEATYARLEQLTETALTAGFSAIADATFLARRRRERFRRLAERLKAPHLILEFQASPEVLRERILARRKEGADLSDADLEVLQRQLAAREPLAEDERFHALTIDASSPEALDRALAAAIRWARDLPNDASQH